MKVKTILSALILLLPFSAIAVPVAAQAPRPAAPSHQQSADAAARKQLAAYMADFKNHPDDATLRDEIIALAKTLKPAPVVPLAARTTFATAAGQLKAASSADDFNAAARLFEQVAAQAPWYADAYFNAASAYAQAADYDSAKRNLALYFAAVRPGVDTQSAEALESDIAQKQAQQQEQARQQQAMQKFQQALQQFQANPNDAAREQIIKLAQAMNPPPAVPEEARGHYVMATTIAGKAKEDTEKARDDSDLKQAAAEFGQAIGEYRAALLAAPWWADVYKKLAMAQETAGQYDDAIASLNLYLLFQTADARDAQDEIYKLKASQQLKNQKAAATAELVDAIHWQKPALFRAAIEKGADVNAKDSNGWSALSTAAGCVVTPPCTSGAKEIVLFLLEKGADINYVGRYGNIDGYTLLMGAAYAHKPDVVRLLIGKGLPLNVKDSLGETALKWAGEGTCDCAFCTDNQYTLQCQRQKAEVIQALKDAGATE